MTTTTNTQELNTRRTAYLEATVIPGLRQIFRKHPELQSATLLLSQFWNDEAADAVHCSTVVSVLDTPDLDAFFENQGWDHETQTDLVDTVNTPFPIDGFELYVATRWDDNGAAIPLFAAFCVGSGSQDQSDEQNCRPYCVLRRSESSPSGFDVELGGTMFRPHLDGVAGEEEQ